MDFVRRWLWPSFVFLYPLAVLPGHTTRFGIFWSHAIVLIAFVVIGFVLEWTAHPSLRLTSLLPTAANIRTYLPAWLAIAFGLWAVLASLASPYPAIAMTGALGDGRDGAFWELAVVAAFVLAYLRAKSDPTQPRRLAGALVLTGCVLATAALVEVATHHGLIYNVSAATLPMTTFPQKGHLAGMLTMAGGAAIGLWSYAGAFLLSMGLGLTFNRSASGAFGLALLPLLWTRFRRGIVVSLVVVLGVVAGVGAVRLANPSGTRDVASRTSLEQRLLIYRAAINGIRAKPIFGFGGGVFEMQWDKYLSRPDLARFLRISWGYSDLVDVLDSPGGFPLFVVKDGSGRTRTLTVTALKTHDQFLGVALMHGLVGLALYLALLYFGVRLAVRAEPLSLAVLAYSAFLLFWPLIPEGQGVLWVVWAGAAAIPWRRDLRTQWDREAARDLSST